LEERNRDLEKAVGSSEKQMMEERRNNDQMSGKIEQMERQNKELKREVKEICEQTSKSSTLTT
jgi:predicted RNase H-like nuclease (RuvC/YqgF family)